VRLGKHPTMPFFSVNSWLLLHSPVYAAKNVLQVRDEKGGGGDVHPARGVMGKISGRDSCTFKSLLTSGMTQGT